MDLIKALANEQVNESAPVVNIGETVKVHCKIKDGNNERIQIFEGTVIGTLYNVGGAYVEDIDMMMVEIGNVVDGPKED